MLIAAVLAAVVGAHRDRDHPRSPREPKTTRSPTPTSRSSCSSDGSLLVPEELTFDFTGNFRAPTATSPSTATPRSPTSGQRGRRKHYGPAATPSSAPSTAPGPSASISRPGAPSGSSGTTTATDEERTFQLVYRVVNAATVHDDVVDVTWTVWGDQWDFGSTTSTRPSPRERRGARPKRGCAPARSGVEPEIGETATVSVDRLPEGRRTSACGRSSRATRSRSTRGANVGPSERPPWDRGGRGELDDDDELHDRRSSRTSSVDNVALLCLLDRRPRAAQRRSASCLLARERRTDTPEYLPEPPEDISAGPRLRARHARASTTTGSSSRRCSTSSTAATTRPAPPPARTSTSRSASPRRPARRARALEKYEVATLDFFDKLLGDNWVALGKMSDRIPEALPVLAQPLGGPEREARPGRGRADLLGSRPDRAPGAVVARRPRRARRGRRSSPTCAPT